MDMKNLFEAMNFCYDGFEKRLREEYSALTTDDVYVCCLLRMGVSNANIVLLLGSNEEALKKRKYRIKREKIGLGKDGLSLEDFLAKY